MGRLDTFVMLMVLVLVGRGILAGRGRSEFCHSCACMMIRHCREGMDRIERERGGDVVDVYMGIFLHTACYGYGLDWRLGVKTHLYIQFGFWFYVSMGWGGGC
ncbi:hypothetical protein B0T17DRAFT_535157 [Bombardia bombarda]|uniref:Secreted protein n=1 Tax=Bombardia bombarda TaxID=252184 RepID=A0AA39WUZ2_9PEZI|nr:hypothetical protein B0T17DRAFT_535157 [Bombardia bombarda]